jgi:hypothetical protein
MEITIDFPGGARTDKNMMSEPIKLTIYSDYV